MAKYIAQIVVTGTQIVGRAFARAVRQEFNASQAAAAARRGSGNEGSRKAAADAYTGMSVQEAKQILNIEDMHNFEHLQKNYDHLFEVNERSKGGSFYIQSKVVRAKERIEMELLREQEIATEKEQKKQQQRAKES